MATLYELTGNYLKLLEYAEDSDPTLYHDTMDSITDAIEVKATNYAKVIKNMDQRISEIKGEIQPFVDETKRLKAKIQTIENSQKRLKANLQESMELIGKQKIKNDLFTINIQGNKPSLSIPDESKIPAYLNKTTVTPDTDRIKEMLKEGKDVPGAELVRTESLRIR